jgi:hypothetical protein
MLDLHTLANLVITGSLLTSPSTAHPLWANDTAPAGNPTACSAPSPSPAPSCQTLYPSEYRVMNSRYPTWDQTPLHGQKDFFMLLRQRADTFQVATQVQFDGLQDAVPPNSTCRLQFQLPAKDMQNTQGKAPIFNVYQVAREAGTPATWNMYEPVAANASVAVFGLVNGTADAQARTWNQTRGLVDIGGTQCNGTLTWQMGMAFEGGEEVNYWDFLGVDPPLNPVQGFRVVTGC